MKNDVSEDDGKALKLIGGGGDCESGKFFTCRESFGGAAKAGDIGPGNRTGC